MRYGSVARQNVRVFFPHLFGEASALFLRGRAEFHIVTNAKLEWQHTDLLLIPRHVSSLFPFGNNAMYSQNISWGGKKKTKPKTNPQPKNNQTTNHHPTAAVGCRQGLCFFFFLQFALEGGTKRWKLQQILCAKQTALSEQKNPQVQSLHRRRERLSRSPSICWSSTRISVTFMSVEHTLGYVALLFKTRLIYFIAEREFKCLNTTTGIFQQHQSLR